MLYFGISILVFFITFVATAPELSPENKAELAMKREVEERLKAEEKAKKEADKIKLEAESKTKQDMKTGVKKEATGMTQKKAETKNK